jgi:DHA2 family methylenomycin A resistance protein-like MFS transporter
MQQQRADATRGSLAAVLLGFFVVMLDTTIVNVALPDVGRSLGAGVAGLQWLVDAYTLTFAGLLLSGGAACDIIGARRVYVVGLTIFGALSVACALAPTIEVLIAARALQGAGAAAVVPGSLALLAAHYPEPRRRARVIGLWGGAGGVAAALGPVLGGLLITSTGWRAVFWVNLPAIAVGCWLAQRHLAPAIGPARRHFDSAGQVTSIAGLACLSYVAIAQGAHGWGAVEATLLIAGLVLLAVFALLQRNGRDPMLPLALFNNRSFAVSTLVGFCLNVSFFGQLFVLSLYFQQYRGLGPLGAGLALAPQACSAVVGSPLGGTLSARIGPFPTMFTGLSIGSAGFISLMVLSHDTPFAWIAILSFTAGLGMAIAMPAATSAAVSAAPARHAGIAGGVVNTARQTGSVFGVALLGGLVSSREFLNGFHRAVGLAGLIFAVAAFTVLGQLLLGGTQPSTDESRPDEGQPRRPRPLFNATEESGGLADAGVAGQDVDDRGDSS